MKKSRPGTGSLGSEQPVDASQTLRRSKRLASKREDLESSQAGWASGTESSTSSRPIVPLEEKLSIAIKPGLHQSSFSNAQESLIPKPVASSDLSGLWSLLPEEVSGCSTLAMPALSQQLLARCSVPVNMLAPAAVPCSSWRSFCGSAPRPSLECWRPPAATSTTTS